LTSKFVPTVNGAAVKIDVSSGVMVNDASVVKADIKAINGVIHIIDKVLLPPSKNLVETALANAPEFSILVEAVQKAKLVETLSTGGPFTVFAPTNAAFAALLAELKVSSLDALSEETVKNVLLYHVVSGRVFSSDLQAGPVNTLNGTFNVNLSNLKITDANMREAGLVPSLLNIQAKNGVIHVIDRVILPK
jgi:transforming growth factor-beta-induced protein